MKNTDGSKKKKKISYLISEIPNFTYMGKIEMIRHTIFLNKKAEIGWSLHIFRSPVISQKNHSR